MTSPDLTLLDVISEDQIVKTLRDRKAHGESATALGPALVVVGGAQERTQDQGQLRRYLNEYKDTSANAVPCPPHPYQLACNAYLYARRTGRDQAVVIATGATSALAARQETIEAVCVLAAGSSASVPGPARSDSGRLAERIQAAEELLDAFTVPCRRPRTHVRYSELQLDDKGRLVGYKVLPFAFALDPKTALGAFDALSALPQTAMRTLGLSRRSIERTAELLDALALLLALDFNDDPDHVMDAAVVSDWQALVRVADLLQVSSESLETTLTHETTFTRDGVSPCTRFLDASGASHRRDELARMLYAALVTWLVESINRRLNRDDFATFLAVIDYPAAGSSSETTVARGWNDLLLNLVAEKLHDWQCETIFGGGQEYRDEGVAVPEVDYRPGSSGTWTQWCGPDGLVEKLDRASSDADFLQQRGSGSDARASASASTLPMVVDHFFGPVAYDPVSSGFVGRNGNALATDFLGLLQAPSCKNEFIATVLAASGITTRRHPRDRSVLVAAHGRTAPLRQPSLLRRHSTKRRTGGHSTQTSLASTVVADGEEDGTRDRDGDRARVQTAGSELTAVDEDGATTTTGPDQRSIASQLVQSLDTLCETLSTTQTWFIFALDSSEDGRGGSGSGLRSQVRALGLAEIAQRFTTHYTCSLTHHEFVQRYAPLLGELPSGQRLDDREYVSSAKSSQAWPDWDCALGLSKVYLSDGLFRSLEDRLRASEGVEDIHLPLVGRYDGKDLFAREEDTPANLDTFASYDEMDMGELGHLAAKGDTRSLFTMDQSPPPSVYAASAYTNLDPKFKEDLPDVAKRDVVQEKLVVTSVRRRWVALVYLWTWMIPDSLIRTLGRKKRSDVRMAWREKLAINLMIWAMCGLAIFVIAILGNLICPKEYVYTPGELQSHSVANDPQKTYTSIRGEVFDLTRFAPNHYPPIVGSARVLTYGGADSTSLFPIQISALCDGVDGSVSESVTINQTYNPYAHDFTYTSKDYRRDWYTEQMQYLRANYRVGFMGFTNDMITSLASSTRTVVILNDNVYDLTPYTAYGGGIAPAGSGANREFLDAGMIQLFQTMPGQDVSQEYANLPMDPALRSRMNVCLRNIFLIGKVDSRNSARCQFARWMLLGVSIILVAIILIKFLAALQFSKTRPPENHEKFVVVQIPCYTEGEDSLRKTIDSVAVTQYDDKHKLLMIICDGMIVGAGNDRPTPQIVLEILGADPASVPEPLDFLSCGIGNKQHNMARVWSGLYERQGHVVPYMVIAKCGKPSERNRPGNRGKRDSQLLLMRFLNKVFHDAAMSPLELEMFHQIKNVIGVNPAFYEFVLMVDADTMIAKDAINRLVSSFTHDRKVIGSCGETSLANAKQTLTSMIQVYEYYISHYLTKAFESLFGSVTCLPGCFSMYRVKTSDFTRAVLVSDAMIDDYSENRTDTLHLKNLLMLGEDRYLTTLMLKHFPQGKLTFTKEAKCQTVAPDSWKVLLSQRRRWINSTVHNLSELIFLDRLCGCCCAGMRFIVLVDLLSTIIAPVVPIYLIYLVYLIASDDGQTIPITSILMLAAIYGLQALIFLFHRRFEFIGWMILSILSLPVWTFALPLYSFWHMDSFDWGSTRRARDEVGREVLITDEGVFDPQCISLQTWGAYESDLWERGSNHSAGSQPDYKDDDSGRGHYDDDRDSRENLMMPSAELGSVGSLKYSELPSRPIFHHQQQGSNYGYGTGFELPTLGTMSNYAPSVFGGGPASLVYSSHGLNPGTMPYHYQQASHAGSVDFQPYGPNAATAQNASQAGRQSPWTGMHTYSH